MTNIIGLVGLTCSGKSLLASAGVEIGMRLVKTRTYVKNGTSFDMDKFLGDLKKLGEKVGTYPIDDFIIIDSLKNLSQKTRIETELHTRLYILGVHCDQQERKFRYAARKEECDLSETIEERDARELRSGFAEVFVESNKILDSTGTTHSEFKGQAVGALLEIVTDIANQKERRTRWNKRDRILCYPKYSVDER